MLKKLLHVKAVEDNLQPNFDAFEAGVRRFVGWKFDPSLGEKDKKGIPQGGFFLVPEGETVVDRSEYRQAVKDGVLIPLNEETARICGVPFNSNSKTRKS